MTKLADLERDYQQLLKEHGLQPNVFKATEEEVRQAYANAVSTEIGSLRWGKINVDRILAIINNSTGYQFLVDYLSNKLERTIRRLYPSFDERVLARDFPTGSFNALAHPTPNGILLLLNTGLVRFMTEAAWAMAMSFPNPGEVRKDMYEGWWTSAQHKRQTAETMARLVLSYLLIEKPLCGKEYKPGQGGIWEMYTSYLAMAVFNFVLAHEFAHAIEGHLTSGSAILLSTPVGNLSLIAKNHKQELEADETAALILIVQWSEDAKANPAEKEVLAINSEFVVSGPILFFNLDSLITRVENELFGKKIPQSLTHPPAMERAAAVRKVFYPFGGDSILMMADGVTDWFSKIEKDVVDVVKKMTCP